MSAIFRIENFGVDPAYIDYDLADVLECIPRTDRDMRWGILNLGWLEDTQDDPWLEKLSSRLTTSPSGLEVAFDDLLRLARGLNNITWLLVVGCRDADPLAITKETLYNATTAIERFDSGPYAVFANSGEFVIALKKRFKCLTPASDLDHRLSTIEPWPK